MMLLEQLFTKISRRFFYPNTTHQRLHSSHVRISGLLVRQLLSFLFHMYDLLRRPCMSMLLPFAFRLLSNPVPELARGKGKLRNLSH